MDGEKKTTKMRIILKHLTVIEKHFNCVIVAQ